MDQKAQTAVEYVLLVGAVIFLVTLVYLVARDRIFNPAQHSIANTSEEIRNVTQGVLD
ncbi:hypothetical protein KJ765_05420 [Candidatus Micrarchaeota archaeon]|nr:hypothetical protein [Candidatus Micrarchaeota archaeon]